MWHCIVQLLLFQASVKDNKTKRRLANVLFTLCKNTKFSNTELFYSELG